MRPDKNLYFMRMARLVATRSTCLRRAVGCVLVDERYHVLSTGYNGVARGEAHCNLEKIVYDGPIKNPGSFGVSVRGIQTHKEYPNACSGATSPSGTNLVGCAAVHAEQNSLLQCRDPFAIAFAFVTVAPCDSCLKLFLNTSCKIIIAGDWYKNAIGESNEEEVRSRWKGTEENARLILIDSRE